MKRLTLPALLVLAHSATVWVDSLVLGATKESVL